MKKSFLLSVTVALLLTFLNVQNTQAMTLDDKGNRWWTIEELSQIEKELDQAISDRCGNDTWCKLTQSPDIINSDGKYMASSMLYGMTMTITDINPEKNTIKVFYNGRDTIMRWENTPAYSIDDFKITYMSSDFSEQYKIFGYSDENISVEDNTETEINLSSSFNFSDDTVKILGYSIVAEPLRAEGSISYSECVESADYEYGMGCKMMISDNLGIKFVPYKLTESVTGDSSEENDETDTTENIESTEPNQNNNSATDDSQAVKSIKQPDTTEPNLTMFSVIDTTLNGTADEMNNATDIIMDESLGAVTIENREEASVVLDAEPEANKIEIPSTGEVNNKIENFPWWAIIVTVCALFLIFTFFPKRDDIKKVKKS